MDQGVDARLAHVNDVRGLHLISLDRNHCAHSRGLQLGRIVGPLKSTPGPKGACERRSTGPIIKPYETRSIE